MDGVQQQLGLNPHANAVKSAHPKGQRPKSADEGRELGEAVLNANPATVEGLADRSGEQLERSQAMIALHAMPQRLAEAAGS